MLPNAEDLAYGRWPEILAAAGLDSAFLTGRPGPCPFCAGKDRYQFQNRNGGRYICRSCTEAKYRSGFDLLMRHMGYSTFREAADHVRGYFNVSPGESAERRVERSALALVRATDEWTPERVSRNLARMQAIWDQSVPVTPDDPVDLYLRRRVPGLQVVPPEIRFHPELPYWDPPATLNGRPSLRGYYPAMVVRGFDTEDRFVQVHKTFLTSDGHKADVPNAKKTDVGVGSNSFALRLGSPCGDSIGVAEGIETALSAMVLRPGTVVWPCHSSTILSNFMVPTSLKGQVRRVIIFRDNDEAKVVRKGTPGSPIVFRRAGQEAGSALADRLRKVGIRSLMIQPAKVGTDMNDFAQCVV
jgi:putative DNA primase/helicase